MALGQKQIIAVIVVVAIAVTIGGIIFALPGGEQSVKGVTYHGNGGHTDAGDDTWKITNDTVIPCIFESDTGRVFKEWNTKADGSGTTYQKNDHVEDGTDLYAIWYQHKILSYKSFESGVKTYHVPLEINSKMVNALGACGFDYTDVNHIATYDDSVTWKTAGFEDGKFVFEGTKMSDDGYEYRYTVKLIVTNENDDMILDTMKEPLIINGKYPMAYLIDVFGDVNIKVYTDVKKIL